MHAISLLSRENVNAVLQILNIVNRSAVSLSLLISRMVSGFSISVLGPLQENLKPLLDTYLSSAAESADDSAVMQQKFCCRTWWWTAVSCTQPYCNWWITSSGSAILLYGWLSSSIRKVGQKNTGRWKESRTSNWNNATPVSLPRMIFFVVCKQ